MTNDILAGPAGSGTFELSRPAEPGTRAMSIGFTSSCNVEAAPLTFERARELAARAKAEFAADRDVLQLKRRISHWANAHDDRLLSRALKAVADYTSGLTHSTSEFRDPAWESIRDHYAELYGTRRSINMLKSDLRPALNTGTVVMSGQVVDEEEACYTGKRTGTRKNNSYWFDFSRVVRTSFTRDPVTGRKVRNDTVIPWDFTQVSCYYSSESLTDDPAESKVDDGSDGGSDSGFDGGSDTVQFSSGSKPVINSSLGSSTAKEGATKGEEPERAEGVVADFVKTDPGNIFILWQAKGTGDRNGEWVEFTKARPPRHQPKDATVVVLAPDEADYLRQTWPMVHGLDAAARAERAGQRAKFLLMPSAARDAFLNGTPADAAEQQDDRTPRDRVLTYLIEYDELDLTGGLPGDLADLGMRVVLDTCLDIQKECRYELAGSTTAQRFGLTERGRISAARYFPYSTVWRVLSRRRYGLSVHELDEIAERYQMTAKRVREVLDELVGDGDVTMTGGSYRAASTEN